MNLSVKKSFYHKEHVLFLKLIYAEEFPLHKCNFEKDRRKCLVFLFSTCSSSRVSFLKNKCFRNVVPLWLSFYFISFLYEFEFFFYCVSRSISCLFFLWKWTCRKIFQILKDVIFFCFFIFFSWNLCMIWFHVFLSYLYHQRFLPLLEIVLVVPVVW